MKDKATTRVENRKLYIFKVLSPIMAPLQISFTSRQTQTARWMQDCALEFNILQMQHKRTSLTGKLYVTLEFRYANLLFNREPEQ